MRWYTRACCAGLSGISLMPWDLNWFCHKNKSTLILLKAFGVVRDTLHMAYLEVQARSNRLVEYDVSVLEGRELVGRGWDYFFLSWKNATFQNIEQNNFVFFFCIAVMLSLF